MALVDAVADGLTDEMAGDGVAGVAVVLELGPLVVDVFLGRGGGIDVEMIAPTGEFEPVVAHFIGQRGEFFEREIGPLAGEECDGS